MIITWNDHARKWYSIDIKLHFVQNTYTDNNCTITSIGYQCMRLHIEIHMNFDLFTFRTLSLYLKLLLERYSTWNVFGSNTSLVYDIKENTNNGISWYRNQSNAMECVIDKFKVYGEIDSKNLNWNSISSHQLFETFCIKGCSL